LVELACEATLAFLLRSSRVVLSLVLFVPSSSAPELSSVSVTVGCTTCRDCGGEFDVLLTFPSPRDVRRGWLMVTGVSVMVLIATLTGAVVRTAVAVPGLPFSVTELMPAVVRAGDKTA
jgi:choline-glycine betaine transporter